MLFSYWDGLRGERAAPERRDLEPGAIRHILADTFILAAEDGGQPSFRLAGTRCTALFGRDLRGRRLADLWPSRQRAEIERQIGFVLSETSGLVAGLRGRAENGWQLDLELTLLPLRHRGRVDARAVGSLSPATLPSWVGLIPLVALETRTIRIVDPARASETGPPSSLAASQRRSRFVVHEGGRAAESSRPVADPLSV